jgi:hypothetical protein
MGNAWAGVVGSFVASLIVFWLTQTDIHTDDHNQALGLLLI